jgi:hypothetical protein
MLKALGSLPYALCVFELERKSVDHEINLIRFPGNFLMDQPGEIAKYPG